MALLIALTFLVAHVGCALALCLTPGIAAFLRFAPTRSVINLAGPVNLASPNPLPYGAFMRTLRRAWGMPVGLPATRWMVELGAFALRTESELALKSRRGRAGAPATVRLRLSVADLAGGRSESV